MDWEERWLYEQMLADDAREEEWAMEQRRKEEEENVDVDGEAGTTGGSQGGASASKQRERVNDGIHPAVARHSNVGAPRNN